jgi:maltose-binding protein MalE
MRRAPRVVASHATHADVLLCAALAICLGAAFAFTGCGGGATSSSTIAIWELMDPGEQAILDSLLAEYQQAHSGITVTHEHYTPEDLRTQYQTAAQAGGGPDLVYGPSDNAGPFSVQHLVQPIDQIVPPEVLSHFLPQALDTLDGHIWLLPDQVGNHLMLMYNKRLIPAPPATMDDLFRLAHAATRDTSGDGQPDRYGIVFNTTEPFWLAPFLGGYGGWVMDRENRPTLGTPAMVKALALVRRFKNEHVIPGECNYEEADSRFKEGSAAMIINGPWSIAGYRAAGIELGIARIPKITETGLWPSPMVSSRGYSVNVHLNPAKKQAVVDLLQFLTSPEAEMRYARAVMTLPSRMESYAPGSPLTTSPLQSAMRDQMDVGRRMPVVPQMRVLWDAMRPGLQDVMNGALSPERAAKRMQAEAEQKIASLK